MQIHHELFRGCQYGSVWQNSQCDMVEIRELLFPERGRHRFLRSKKMEPRTSAATSPRARAATPPSRQPWASPSSAPPSRRRELLWTAPRRVRVTRANSASSFRSLRDSGIIMNYLLQYCADSRVPRTDHIMYRFTQCSIMHLQVPDALIARCFDSGVRH